MKNKEKTTWLQTAGILLFAAACTMALYSLYLCFGSDIWYDELFTEGFISQPVGRMISLAVKDVHPPLYYLLVKIAVDFCRFFVPSANAVIISKVVSVLPYLGLLGYSLVFLRRRYGWLCAGLFSFCIFAMPQMANYTTEVRMYGFALFFITAAFFHAGAILENGGKRNWIALTVFGICAAYTHYFAAVSAVVLYVGLAVLLYVRKKDTRTKSLLTWILCVGISVLAYLPWLPDAVGQVSQVRENYWILPLTLSCFGGCVKFVLKPSTGYQWPDYVLAVLLFVLLAGLLAAAFFKRKEDEKKAGEDVYAFFGLCILAGTALFGIAVSFLMRPVFIYRYMLPSMGCFWFGFVSLLSRQKKKRVLVPALVLLCLVGVADYSAFAKGEFLKKEQMDRTLEELSRIGEEDAVIFNFDQVQAVAGYYMDQESWLYGNEPESLIKEMFPDIHGIQDMEGIRQKLQEGQRVWFIGSGLIREDILKEWAKEGILSVETADSCLLERYWFNIYRLELGGMTGTAERTISRVKD